MPSLSQPQQPQITLSRRERLETYVRRFTINWPTRNHDIIGSKNPEANAKEVFFLTGTTGTLGSQILAELIMRPYTMRIYAFNRPHPKTSSRQRHESIFLDKGSSIKLLQDPKVVYVEGDLSVPGFGVAKELYEEMNKSVTTIIHNAWPVKFTKPLTDFEVNLRGVRNLIDFSLQSPHLSPPRILFMSSIGMVKAWANIPLIPNTPFMDVDLVGESGYGESKWVAERILAIASEETELKPLIIRVGQISGGVNGSWNVNEWFPALVNSVGFVPLQKCANAVIDLRNASSLSFAHIVHPNPITWTTLMNFVSHSLNLKIVSIEEWLTKLRFWGSKTRNTKHPAFKLISFYEHNLYPKDEDIQRLTEKYQITGLAMFDTEMTSRSIPFDLEQLDKNEVEKWIGYWSKQPSWVNVGEKGELILGSGHRDTVLARL
ncbi:putative secondary metabolism biosyntheticenzyme [Clathrus columnatus]|uniref:Secondary metabolism biosyntheticenzyme n=1 Tax=Clathrus columnatus TaxID=1419009 RepID=A0AAV5AFB1_9AGAM|nr:putative secondary metabolism biosyntheticenzyme [Clathrus columnatus]